MANNRIIHKMYDLCGWIAKLMYLNILWMIFTLLGLIIVGFFPATVAMFSITRKWLMKEEVSIYKTFRKIYMEEFFKANMLGYILGVIGYIFLLEFKFFQMTADPLLRPIAYLFVLLLIIYLAVILYAFPVFVHYDMKLFSYIKYTFFMAMGRIFQSFVMIMSSVIVYFIFSYIPGLIPFIGGSVFSLLLMWISSKSFPQMSTS